MIEIKEEILHFTQLFNQLDDEFKKLFFDRDAVENVVADGDFYDLADSNAGAIGNTLEYERRLARFLIDMLFLDRAAGQYLDNIGDTWLDNPRPDGYDDVEYYSYLVQKIIGQKETPLAIVALLQPFSSIPVQILELGAWHTNMFLTSSWLGYYFVGKTSTGEIITPAIIGPSQLGADGIFFFRVIIQPISAIAERIILILLEVAHVAGVKYEIQYDFVPTWH